MVDIDDEEKHSPKDMKSLHKKWKNELDASHKRVKKFHKTGDKIDKKFRSDEGQDSTSGNSRLNLFHSNAKTLLSMLYGNLPKVDISRKYADANDDQARVAAVMLERMINCELETNGAEISTVLKSVAQDRLLPGLGCAKVRYAFDEGPTVDDATTVAAEYAHTDYFYWKDVRWGWGRSFIKLPWVAFRTYLDKEAFKKRFPDTKLGDVNFEARSINSKDNDGYEEEGRDVSKQTAIWEIWCKKTRNVYWFSDDHDTMLDKKKDPLKLAGFFPCPPFLAANTTTANYMPVADYKIVQDMYNKIDVLQTRIDKITQAIRLVGAYDGTVKELGSMLGKSTDGKMIPVDKWAMFAEKGGLRNSVEWFPIKEVVDALNNLMQARNDEIGLLQQVTGMADVMRGELDNQYEGVGQTKEKAKFGSFRVQALQEEFSRFATDLMQLKVEIIAKHFDPKTIVNMSNMRHGNDVALIPQAVELIKNPSMVLRVKIQPEQMAMTDFAQMQQERSAFLKGMSAFLKTATPMMESKPETAPFFLEMMRWTMSAFKGASEIEGVMDKAIEATTEAAKKTQNKPDVEKAKLEGQMRLIEAKKNADLAVRDADRQSDIQTIMAEHKTNMEAVNAKHQGDMLEIQAKTEAAIRQEMETSAANTQQMLSNVQAEMAKGMQEFQLTVGSAIQKAGIDADIENIKHNNKIKEIKDGKKANDSKKTQE